MDEYGGRVHPGLILRLRESRGATSPQFRSPAAPGLRRVARHFARLFILQDPFRRHWTAEGIAGSQQIDRFHPYGLETMQPVRPQVHEA
jgi:hypothetical protein